MRAAAVVQGAVRVTLVKAHNSTHLDALALVHILRMLLLMCLCCPNAS
jgi:hypothetical protein